MASGNPPGVAMIRAKGPVLSKEGAFLAVFHRGAVLCFQGCVQLRVLVGLIQVAGYVVKPSGSFHPLYSPLHQSALVLAAVDPSVGDEEFAVFVKPLRRQPLLFQCKGSEQARGGLLRVSVDLELEDIEQLNYVVRSAAWGDVAAVAVLKCLHTPLIDVLRACGGSSLLDVNSEMISGFKTTQMSPHPSHPSLEIPSHFHQLAWDVMTFPNPVVLVCGDVGTGKSTLCRFLLNYMLNRYSMAGFLECDVGQTEFTVPGVIALNIVTEPLLGPPYLHIREPEKAYYYGDKSPKGNPVFYVRLIKTLFAHFVERVRPKCTELPLIINTCGWLNDMGVPIFVDLVRLLSPTHILRLLPQYGMWDPRRELVALTPELLNSTPGLLTRPKVTVVGSDLLQGMGASGSGSAPVSSADPTHQSDPTPQSEPASPSPPPSPGATPYDPIVISDSDMSLDESDSSSSEAEEGESRLSAREKQEQQRRKQRRRHSKAWRERRRQELASQVTSVEFGMKAILGLWRKVLSHWVCTLKARKNSGWKDSRKMRHLNLISYFSPLFSEATEISRGLDLPFPHRNFLLYAPPLEIPWSNVAVHVLHRKVPNSQVLYAMNGQFVALGRVDLTELIDVSSKFDGMVKFLKSPTPLIQFIGLGLLRGIDPEKQLFYVTTPEPQERLRRVNTLVVGNSDSPEYRAMDTMPYFIKGFRACQWGWLAWRN